MSDVKDLAKERSQFAYGCVCEVWNPYLEVKKDIENKKIDCKDKNLSDSNKKICKDLADKYKVADNYQSYVKKIPMMILTNGFGATFAFVYSKKKNGNAWELIYTQTKVWFQVPEKDELVKWIIDQDSQLYRATTNEVLALFNWLKRFADGMIEGEGDD